MYFLIRKLAMGPPVRLPSINPIVEAVTPISIALLSLNVSEKLGDHAIVTPWPPTRETVPNTRPMDD